MLQWSLSTMKVATFNIQVDLANHFYYGFALVEGITAASRTVHMSWLLLHLSVDAQAMMWFTERTDIFLIAVQPCISTAFGGFDK